MKNIAVLTIDMQEDFLNSQLVNPKEKILESHKKLYSHCIKNNIPVLNLRHSEGGGEFSKEIKNYLKKVPRVKNLTKKGDGAFVNPKVKEQLDEWETERLIITGYSGPHCVQTSAIMAKGKGYEIYSSKDLVTAHEFNKHKHKNDFMNWFVSESFFYDNHIEMIEDLQKL